MTARELMTEDPVTVSPQATIAEAWDLMREMDVRHLPVVERDVVVGMLSDRDVGSLEVERLLTAEGADTLRRRLARPVMDFMSSDVVTVEPGTDVGELITIFIEEKIGAVPVIDPETWRLMGIVSYIDVLRAVQEALAAD
jgi:acetoin utilization protein AcuB